MTAIPDISVPDPYQRVVRILSSDSARVLAAIPGAAAVQSYPSLGKTTIDVPFDLHNMTVLSQMLQPAVSPMVNDYTWPGRYKPFHHQRRIAEFLTRNPRAYCFSGMGTGKTISALWAADYLMQIGLVRKVLVVCPKTLMYSAWVNDIHSSVLHRTWTVLHGERKQREKLALTRDTDFDIVNFDGVEILGDILTAKPYDLVIIDECTAYKDASTKRWRALAKLIRPDTRCWGLTGTPTPQGPMDAYGQAKLLTPDRIPRTKTAFQSMVQYKVSTFIWRDRKGWQDTVHDIMQPAIYIKKADCLDLPPVTRTFLDVGLSRPQQQSVEALSRDMLANFESGHQAVAANAAVLHGKLRQVYSGSLYAEGGDTMVLDNKARINETIDLIHRAKASGDAEAAGGKPHSKALVFVPFRHALSIVGEALEKAGFNVATISGDTGVQERRHIIDQFQNTNAPDVILAIPEAFSHGVTATAASLIVWFAPPSRTETYLQACERTDRPGQTQHQNIVHLFGDKTEREMYQSLIDNQMNQETLMKLYYNVLGLEQKHG